MNKLINISMYRMLSYKSKKFDKNGKLSYTNYNQYIEIN